MGTWVLVITVWFVPNYNGYQGGAIAITNIPGYSESVCKDAAARVRKSGGDVKAICVPGPDMVSK